MRHLVETTLHRPTVNSRRRRTRKRQEGNASTAVEAVSSAHWHSAVGLILLQINAQWRIQERGKCNSGEEIRPCPVLSIVCSGQLWQLSLKQYMNMIEYHWRHFSKFMGFCALPSFPLFLLHPLLSSPLFSLYLCFFLLPRFFLLHSRLPPLFLLLPLPSFFLLPSSSSPPLFPSPLPALHSPTILSFLAPFVPAFSFSPFFLPSSY